MAQPATRNLGRLSEIAQVAVRHGFGYWFDTHRLTDLFPRRGGRVELDGALVEMPAYSNAKRMIARAEALRQFARSRD
jgi:hypothetical protein